MNQQDSIQVQVPNNALQEANINIASPTLRAPVMQIDTTKPAHLIQPRPVITKPHISYQKLTHSDSVFLNLIQEDSDRMFYSDHGINAMASSNSNLITTPQVNVTSSVQKDTISIEPRISKEHVETLTISPETNPFKVRGNNHFNECKEWLSGFILFSLIIAGTVKLTSGKYLNDIFSSIRYQQSALHRFQFYTCCQLD